MPDILHRLRVNAPAADVFRAITDRGLLGAPSWTAIDMSVVDVEEGARITWRCIGGPAEWIGTDITFDLEPDDGSTVLRFGHRHWREANDAMAECATKWAGVLFNLKSWVETPEPDDVMIGV